MKKKPAQRAKPKKRNVEAMGLKEPQFKPKVIKDKKKAAKRRGPPTLMERTHAARLYSNNAHSNNEKLAMSAFMALFHPEFPEDKTIMLIRDAK